MDQNVTQRDKVTITVVSAAAINGILNISTTHSYHFKRREGDKKEEALDTSLQHITSARKKKKKQFSTSHFRFEELHAKKEERRERRRQLIIASQQDGQKQT